MKFWSRSLPAFLVLISCAVFTLETRGQRRQVPDIKMATVDGKVWTLSELRGKVVILNFWATWCAPCRTEVPYLVALGNEHKKDGLEIAGISLDEDLSLVPKFIAEYKVNYPILVPEPASPWRALDNTPTTFLIDRQGRLIQTYVGAVPEETLRTNTESALAEQ